MPALGICGKQKRAGEMAELLCDPVHYDPAKFSLQQAGAEVQTLAEGSYWQRRLRFCHPDGKPLPEGKYDVYYATQLVSSVTLLPAAPPPYTVTVYPSNAPLHILLARVFADVLMHKQKAVTVCVMPGVYNVTQTITIPLGMAVTIDGGHYAQVVLLRQHNANDWKDKFFDTQRVQSLALRNLTFRLAEGCPMAEVCSAPGDTMTPGNSPQNLRVVGCWFDPDMYAVVENGEVIGCHFDRSGLLHGSNMLVKGCEFFGHPASTTSYTGLVSWGTNVRDCLMLNNTFRDGEGAFTPRLSNSVMANLSFQRCWYGNNRSECMLVEGDVFDDNYVYRLLFADCLGPLFEVWGGNMRHNTFVHVHSTGPSNAGFVLKGLGTGVIANNLFREMQFHRVNCAFDMDECCANNTVEDSGVVEVVPCRTHNEYAWCEYNPAKNKALFVSKGTNNVLRRVNVFKSNGFAINDGFLVDGGIGVYG